MDPVHQLEAYALPAAWELLLRVFRLLGKATSTCPPPPSGPHSLRSWNFFTLIQHALSALIGLKTKALVFHSGWVGLIFHDVCLMHSLSLVASMGLAVSEWLGHRTGTWITWVGRHGFEIGLLATPYRFYLPVLFCNNHFG